MDNTNKRRSNERFDFDVYCLIDGFNEVPIKISNISSGGMFLMTDKPLPSNLELSFKILDAENHILYSGRGTIKWGTIIKNPKTQSVSRGCGIQFFEVSPVGKRLEFEAYLRDVYFKLNGKEYPKEKKEQQ